MRTLTRVVILFIITSGMLPGIASAQTPQDIPHMIVQEARFTPEQMAILQLRLVPISVPTEVFMYDSVSKKFAPGILQTGDIVAVRYDGALAYKVATGTAAIAMTQREYDDRLLLVRTQVFVATALLVGFLVYFLTWFGPRIVGKFYQDRYDRSTNAEEHL